jgi:hypothetical protein
MRQGIFSLLPTLLCLAPWSVGKAQEVRNLEPKPTSVAMHSDKYPIGSLGRPDSGVKDQKLDVAWQAYADAITAATNQMHDAINEREQESRKLGDIEAVGRWQDVRDTFRSYGFLSELPCDAANLEATVATVEQAEASLLGAYDSLIKDKTKQGDYRFARSARNEERSLLKYAAVAFLPICRNLLIDCVPEKDAVAGKWRKVDNGIRSDPSGPAKLKVRVQPPLPKQFDYIMVFTPEDGVRQPACAQLVTAYGVGFGCDYGGWGNQIVALHSVSGLTGDSNKTTTRAKNRQEGWLRKGELNVAILSVREESVSAFLNGEQVFVFPTDYDDLAHRRDWAIPIGDFGVGSWETPTVFHRVTLIPM